MSVGAAELSNRFSYHPPKANQGVLYEAIRAKARELADLIDMSAPDNREKSLALTHLDEVVMFATASIARGERH